MLDPVLVWSFSFELTDSAHALRSNPSGPPPFGAAEPISLTEQGAASGKLWIIYEYYAGSSPWGFLTRADVSVSRWWPTLDKSSKEVGPILSRGTFEQM